jgi:hypothetical protein
MVEHPKQSEIPNVFGMDHPQHMFVKLGWELNALMSSMSVWKDNEAAPESLSMLSTLPSRLGMSPIGSGNTDFGYCRSLVRIQLPRPIKSIA